MWMEDGVLNRRNLEMKQAEDEDVSWVIGYKKTGVKGPPGKKRGWRGRTSRTSPTGATGEAGKDRGTGARDQPPSFSGRRYPDGSCGGAPSLLPEDRGENPTARPCGGRSAPHGRDGAGPGSHVKKGVGRTGGKKLTLQQASDAAVSRPVYGEDVDDTASRRRCRGSSSLQGRRRRYSELLTLQGIIQST